MKTFLTSIMMIIASSCLAAKENFGFRGVRLGYSPTQVLESSKKSIEFTSQLLVSSKTRVFVSAGNSIGFKKNGCPDSHSTADPDCLYAVFSLLSVNASEPSLAFIYVTQKFREPIPKIAFLEKAYRTYGSPRHLLSTPGNHLGNQRLTNTTLVWGGDNPAPKDFKFDLFYGNEMSILGGIYASMLVVSDGPKVLEYHLRIADSDRYEKHYVQEEIRIKREAEKSRKAIIDSVQF